MQLDRAQAEVRSVYMGGFPGQIVSALLWGVAAALGTWSAPRHAIAALVVGGVFIYPLSQLPLRMAGHRASLDVNNQFGQLAMQIALTIPLSLPAIAAATRYRLNWFFPAFMVVVGAHYLPFVLLYGMWEFAMLAGVLVGGGGAVGLFAPSLFSLGGWLTAAMLFVFAFIGHAAMLRAPRSAARRE